MINLSKPSLEKCEQCLFKKTLRQYISEEDFLKLYNSSIQLHYKKGETILKQGSKFTHFVYLSKGCVKFNYENEFGKNAILTLTSSPSLLGGANFFNADINLFSIKAIDDCEACLIDISIFKNIVLQNMLLGYSLLELSTSMFKDSILHFINLSHKQVSGKVADIILFLRDKIYKQNEFVLTLTRKELAEFAGCSSENIINTLSRFDKEGIISSDGKDIKILDEKRLLEISRLG
jgi:CRP/FNR family transcriptional regulator